MCFRPAVHTLAVNVNMWDCFPLDFLLVKLRPFQKQLIFREQFEELRFGHAVKSEKKKIKIERPWASER